VGDLNFARAFALSLRGSIEEPHFGLGGPGFYNATGGCS
jgi:hypothetical protein